MSQQGVTQLASTQWIARPLMPVEPAKNSSLLGHYSLRLSLMLPIVTHGLVSRRWRLPSIRPLGSSSSVKLTAIDWAVPMWQSLKSGRKSGMRGWFSCETANLPVRPMAGTEIVPLPPVVSHQTVSPPPSSEKTNLSSSKTPPTSQLTYKELPRAHTGSAYSSSNFGNHGQLSSERPIKRRKLGRTPGAFAEITRGPINEFVDTTNDASDISAQRSSLEPPFRRIRLKRTVNSAKDSSDNRTSPATSESFLAAGGTDILPMSQEEIQFWVRYCKPLTLNLARGPAFRDPEYMEILQSEDSTTDINQLLQWVTVFAEVHPEHRARQAQVTRSLGGIQPAIVHSLADE
ncbi:MAG: hypothetical protein AB2989_05780 [Candidatus Symbiodolus clandestinus]